MCNIVFLIMNIRCSKRVEDKRNSIKTLMQKVHFVGEHYIKEGTVVFTQEYRFDRIC